MQSKTFIGVWCAAAALATGVWAGDQCGMQNEASANGAANKVAIQTADMAAHPAADFPEIARADLAKAVADKSVFVVDANSAESFAAGRIPGAVHFDADAQTFSGPLPKNKEAFIVAYCGGPGCQAWCGAASALKKMGYTNIHHYKGGIKGWKTAGLKVDKSEG